MPRFPNDAEVEVTFLSAENGGRSGPAVSGYRPQLHYDGRDWDAVQTFSGRDEAAPGETVRAYLSFLGPELHAGRIRPCMPFLVREGSRVVGYGVVLRVLAPEDPAERARRAGQLPPPPAPS